MLEESASGKQTGYESCESAATTGTDWRLAAAQLPQPPKPPQPSPFRTSVPSPDAGRQTSRTSTDQTAAGSDRTYPNVAAAPGRGVTGGVTGDRNTSESTAHTEPTTDDDFRLVADSRPQVSVLKPILKTQPQPQPQPQPQGTVLATETGEALANGKSSKRSSNNGVDKSYTEAFKRKHASKLEKANATRSMSQQQMQSPAKSSSKKKKKKHKRSLTAEIQNMGGNTSAQVSKSPDDPFFIKINTLVNYVYGETSEAEHDVRISTILKAYRGRELILMKLLETKADVKEDTDTRASLKGNKKSSKSAKSSKSSKGSRDKIPRHISYESSAGDDSSDDAKSYRSRSAPPRARKGITKSSNGDDDTISDISYGTAKFTQRQALWEAEDATSTAQGSKKSAEGSSKENKSTISSSSKMGKAKRNIFGFKRGGMKGSLEGSTLNRTAIRTESKGETTVESGFNEI
jgi:hypothetical protein